MTRNRRCAKTKPDISHRSNMNHVKEDYRLQSKEKMERGRRSENESLQLPWSLSAPKYSPIIPGPTAHRGQRLTALDVSNSFLC